MLRCDSVGVRCAAGAIRHTALDGSFGIDRVNSSQNNTSSATGLMHTRLYLGGVSKLVSVPMTVHTIVVCPASVPHVCRLSLRDAMGQAFPFRITDASSLDAMIDRHIRSTLGES